jgi:hypothetical protein
MLPRLSALLLFVVFGAASTPPKLVVPDFPDFKIKTRITFGTRLASVNTLYMRGARTRAEYNHQASNRPEEQQLSIIMLTQCDRMRSIGYDPQHKTFTEWSILDRSNRVRNPPLQAQQSGPEVSISVNSVETGEHRQVGPYVARHVKTTTTVEYPQKASIPSVRTEIDGWYIDLPHLSCEDWGERNHVEVGPLITSPNQRVRYTHTGTGKRGYPVEEIVKSTGNSHSYESRVELLEASSDKLDPKLFDLPAGYTHALQSPLGVDYSRPDTIANRTAAYWTYLRQRMGLAFRSSSGSCKPRCPSPTPSASL